MTIHPARGNAPGVSRRAMLAALPAFGLASTAALAESEDAKALRLFRDASPERQAKALELLDAPEVPETDTPILRLFRQWQALYEAANDPEITEEECEATCDQYRELEHRMLALPSECTADFAAKVCAYTSFGAFPLEEDVAPGDLGGGAEAGGGGADDLNCRCEEVEAKVPKDRMSRAA